MILNQLLETIEPVKIIGQTEIDIRDICFDSRKVQPQSLFVAQCGVNVDGHSFLADVINRGAAAVVIQANKEADLEEKVLQSIRNQLITTVVVQDTDETLGLLAAAWYGHPSHRLKLVGVTGTNGKTTIATLLYNLTRFLGAKAGLISTIENIIEGEVIPTDHTTPDALTIQSLLAKMVEKGCQYAFMEVSSHAIAQKRIAGLRFHIAAFTNLTRDHLDYHKTFDEYRDTKQSLFTHLPTDAFAITNLDDRNGLVMSQKSKAQLRTYSLTNPSANYHAQLVEMQITGMQLLFNGNEFYTPLVGLFNISNLLCIYAVADLLGFEKSAILTQMSRLHPAKGRFQVLHTKEGKTAIIDYAHTPDAVENVLKTIQHLMQNSPDQGRIITVIGCGGNRDKGKRPLMAKIAYLYSQQLILTSDNPRNEDPIAIIDDMKAGLTPTQQQQTLCIPDRQTAIQTACTLASKNDIVLIAGKGHENYQIIQGVKHHFDDFEIAQRYL